MVGDDGDAAAGIESPEPFGVLQVTVHEDELVETFSQRFVGELHRFVEAPRAGFEDFDSLLAGEVGNLI